MTPNERPRVRVVVCLKQAEINNNGILTQQLQSAFATFAARLGPVEPKTASAVTVSLV